MDEEDAAAPVGGDRGRGPGGLGSPWSLRREAGVLDWGSAVMGGALCSGLGALPPQDPQPGAGPGETGRSHIDGQAPLPSGLV